MENKMAIPDEVKKLVDNFKSQQGECKKGDYNETQVRGDFIGLFFSR